MPRKILSFVLSFVLLFSQSGLAQLAGELNLAGYLSRFQSAQIDKLRLPALRYFSYDNLSNNFKIILDKGDLKEIKGSQLQDSANKLFTYFLIGISLPNECFWVNLRPDSQDEIIDNYLAQTDVGRILLEADLQLKKDTAQFTSPQTPEGKEYYDKLTQKAEELFGSSQIDIPTLTRPWIVPGEVIIRETQDSAYVYKATLKVMLEQDHLKGSAAYSFTDPRLKALNEYASELIRRLILPKLTKEVNISKRYANLRQVYYSLILARWFKARFYGKGGTYSWFIDRKNLTGLTSKEPWSKSTYFKQYQKSFKQGEYNLQAPVAGSGGRSIRNYFSGGVDWKVSSPVTGGLSGRMADFDKKVAGVPFIGSSPIVLNTPLPSAIREEGKVAASPAQNEDSSRILQPADQRVLNALQRLQENTLAKSVRLDTLQKMLHTEFTIEQIEASINKIKQRQPEAPFLLQEGRITFVGPNRKESYEVMKIMDLMYRYPGQPVHPEHVLNNTALTEEGLREAQEQIRSSNADSNPAAGSLGDKGAGSVRPLTEGEVARLFGGGSFREAQAEYREGTFERDGRMLVLTPHRHSLPEKVIAVRDDGTIVPGLVAEHRYADFYDIYYPDNWPARGSHNRPMWFVDVESVKARTAGSPLQQVQGKEGAASPVDASSVERFELRVNGTDNSEHLSQLLLETQAALKEVNGEKNRQGSERPRDLTVQSKSFREKVDPHLFELQERLDKLIDRINEKLSAVRERDRRSHPWDYSRSSSLLHPGAASPVRQMNNARFDNWGISIKEDPFLAALDRKRDVIQKTVLDTLGADNSDKGNVEILKGFSYKRQGDTVKGSIWLAYEIKGNVLTGTIYFMDEDYSARDVATVKAQVSTAASPVSNIEISYLDLTIGRNKERLTPRESESIERLAKVNLLKQLRDWVNDENISTFQEIIDEFAKKFPNNRILLGQITRDTENFERSLVFSLVAVGQERNTVRIMGRLSLVIGTDIAKVKEEYLRMVGDANVDFTLPSAASPVDQGAESKAAKGSDATLLPEAAQSKVFSETTGRILTALAESDTRATDDLLEGLRQYTDATGSIAPEKIAAACGGKITSVINLEKGDIVIGIIKLQLPANRGVPPILAIGDVGDRYQSSSFEKEPGDPFAIRDSVLLRAQGGEYQFFHNVILLATAKEFALFKEKLAATRSTKSPAQGVEGQSPAGTVPQGAASPVTLAEARRAYRYIAVSMGGNKLAVSLNDGNNNTIASKELRWDSDPRFDNGQVIGTEKTEEVMETLLGMIASLVKENEADPGKIKVLSLGLAGPVDNLTGVFGSDFKTPNLPFDKYPLRQELNKRLERIGISAQNIEMYNDARAALNGEHFSPKGKLRGKKGGIVIIGGGINIAVDIPQDRSDLAEEIREAGHNLHQEYRLAAVYYHYAWVGNKSKGGHPIERGNTSEEIIRISGDKGREYVWLGEAKFRERYPDYPFIEWAYGLRDLEDRVSGPNIRKRIKRSWDGAEGERRAQYYDIIDAAAKEGKLGELERGLTPEALKGNPVAIKWIKDIAGEIGIALAAFLATYQEQDFTQNLVLVSGVNENLGKGVYENEQDQAAGLDIFIKYIRQRAKDELAHYFHIEEQLADRLANGIIRSSLTYERELVAYQPTDKEVLASAASSSSPMTSDSERTLREAKGMVEPSKKEVAGSPVNRLSGYPDASPLASNLAASPAKTKPPFNLENATDRLSQLEKSHAALDKVLAELRSLQHGVSSKIRELEANLMTLRRNPTPNPTQEKVVRKSLGELENFRTLINAKITRVRSASRMAVAQEMLKEEGKREESIQYKNIYSRVIKVITPAMSQGTEQLSIYKEEGQGDKRLVCSVSIKDRVTVFTAAQGITIEDISHPEDSISIISKRIRENQQNLFELCSDTSGSYIPDMNSFIYEIQIFPLRESSGMTFRARYEPISRSPADGAPRPAASSPVDKKRQETIKTIERILKPIHIDHDKVYGFSDAEYKEAVETLSKLNMTYLERAAVVRERHIEGYKPFVEREGGTGARLLMGLNTEELRVIEAAIQRQKENAAPPSDTTTSGSKVQVEVQIDKSRIKWNKQRLSERGLISEDRLNEVVTDLFPAILKIEIEKDSDILNRPHYDANISQHLTPMYCRVVFDPADKTKAKGNFYFNSIRDYNLFAIADLSIKTSASSPVETVIGSAGKLSGLQFSVEEINWLKGHIPFAGLEHSILEFLASKRAGTYSREKEGNLSIYAALNLEVKDKRGKRYIVHLDIPNISPGSIAQGTVTVVPMEGSYETVSPATVKVKVTSSSSPAQQVQDRGAASPVALGETDNNTRPVNISLSVGGTKVGAGAVGVDGSLIITVADMKWLDRFGSSGKETKTQELVEGMLEQIAKVINQGDINISTIQKIGISFAGPVDSKTGIVGTPFAAPNLNFDHYQLQAELERLLKERYSRDIPVDIDNDCGAAVRGELSPKGALAGLNAGTAWIFGTGINATAAKKGRPYYGEDNGIRELGHNLVPVRNLPRKYVIPAGAAYAYLGRQTLGDHPTDDQGRPLKGDLEDVLSGPNIDRYFQTQGYNLKDITEQAKQGDIKAIALIKGVGVEIGQAIAAFMLAYINEDFIRHNALVSGVSENLGKGVAGDPFISAVRDSAKLELVSRGVAEETARELVEGIVRSPLTYERELVAFTPTAASPVDVQEGLRIIKRIQSRLEAYAMLLDPQAVKNIKSALADLNTEIPIILSEAGLQTINVTKGQLLGAVGQSYKTIKYWGEHRTDKNFELIKRSLEEVISKLKNLNSQLEVLASSPVEQINHLGDFRYELGEAFKKPDIYTDYLNSTLRENDVRIRSALMAKLKRIVNSEENRQVQPILVCEGLRVLRFSEWRVYDVYLSYKIMQRSITGDVYLGQKIKIGSVRGRIVKGAASPVEKTAGSPVVSIKPEAIRLYNLSPDLNSEALKNSLAGALNQFIQTNTERKDHRRADAENTFELPFRVNNRRLLFAFSLPRQTGVVIGRIIEIETYGKNQSARFNRGSANVTLPKSDAVSDSLVSTAGSPVRRPMPTLNDYQDWMRNNVNLSVEWRTLFVGKKRAIATGVIKNIRTYGNDYTVIELENPTDHSKTNITTRDITTIAPLEPKTAASPVRVEVNKFYELNHGFTEIHSTDDRLKLKTLRELIEEDLDLTARDIERNPSPYRKGSYESMLGQADVPIREGEQRLLREKTTLSLKGRLVETAEGYRLERGEVYYYGSDEATYGTQVVVATVEATIKVDVSVPAVVSSPAKENFGDSPLRGQSLSSGSPLQPGGIDFRSIPATLQPIGNFGNLKFIAPDIRTLQKMNLNAEAQALEGMLEKGILPSSQRVKEFIYACSYKKELGARTEQLVSLLTDMCRLQEECVCESEPELRESLMIIEAVESPALAADKDTELEEAA